jgi:hypothetical protein
MVLELSGQYDGMAYGVFVLCMCVRRLKVPQYND